MSVFKRGRDPISPAQPLTRFSAAVSAPPPEPEPVPAPPVQVSASETTARPEASQRPAKAFERDTAAVLDRNSQLSGTLHSQGNILIEGVFKGEIEAKETVLIEKDARAEGRIAANEVIVSGAYDGEVASEHRLQITSTASIKGEVKTPILVVEDGSIVDCRFEMTRAGR